MKRAGVKNISIWTIFKQGGAKNKRSKMTKPNTQFCSEFDADSKYIWFAAKKMVSGLSNYVILGKKYEQSWPALAIYFLNETFSCEINTGFVIRVKSWTKTNIIWLIMIKKKFCQNFRLGSSSGTLFKKILENFFPTKYLSNRIKPLRKHRILFEYT